MGLERLDLCEKSLRAKYMIESNPEVCTCD